MTDQNKGTRVGWPGDARLSCQKRDGVKCRQASKAVSCASQGGPLYILSDQYIDDNSTTTILCGKANGWKCVIG